MATYSSPQQLAVIGAGAAGLSAARAISQQHPAISVTIFEQGRHPGGRIVTHQRDGFTFDQGAQLLRTPTPADLRFFTDELASETLRRIEQPVWVFDADGLISEGDPLLNAEPTWTYADGLERLAQQLAVGLDIRYHTRVAALVQQEDRRWLLRDEQNQELGSFDAVLLTPPAPQTAALLEHSQLDAQLQAALLATLRQASYRPCISFALAYNRLLARPFFALVNPDRRHPISWISMEHDKAPERCPAEHALIVAQMAGDWSAAHWQEPLEQLLPPLTDMLSNILGEDLDTPLWAERQDWPHSLPDSLADFAQLNHSGSGLFFAGDYTQLPGRIHLAVESGHRVAALIAGRA